MRVRWLAVSAVVLTLASVVFGQDGEKTQPKRGEPFELKARETRELADRNLRVRFDSVSQDSRCPIGVQCVWAGDAAVELTLEKPPAAAETRTLHTSGRFDRETDYAGLVVRLVSLEPNPRDGATIAPEDYRVTLVVDDKAAPHFQTAVSSSISDISSRRLALPHLPPPALARDGSQEGPRRISCYRPLS